jgi:hypothetical protein
MLLLLHPRRGPIPITGRTGACPCFSSQLLERAGLGKSALSDAGSTLGLLSTQGGLVSADWAEAVRTLIVAIGATYPSPTDPRSE